MPQWRHSLTWATKRLCRSVAAHPPHTSEPIGQPLLPRGQAQCPRGLAGSRQLCQATERDHRNPSAPLRVTCGIPTELPPIEDWAARISDDDRGRSASRSIPLTEPQRRPLGNSRGQPGLRPKPTVRCRAKRTGIRRVSYWDRRAEADAVRCSQAARRVSADWPRRNADSLRARAARISTR